jgi:hypothetical protein
MAADAPTPSVPLDVVRTRQLFMDPNHAANDAAVSADAAAGGHGSELLAWSSSRNVTGDGGYRCPRRASCWAGRAGWRRSFATILSCRAGMPRFTLPTTAPFR